MSIELADAYVSIIPSARGLAAAIGSELAPAAALAQGAGDKAGVAFSGRFGGQLKSLLPASFQGINFGALFAAAVPVGIGIALLKIGEDFQKVRHQIEDETGATGAALTGLFDTVKREATKVPASLTDITAAVDELQRRGVPLGAMFDKLATQELFLAKITKSDLASNVDLTTGLFAKFNVPLRDQSRELDVLFKAQQASGKGLEPLIESLQKGGAQLQLFGFSLDSSIALIAGLERAGVNVQPVLFSLRTAFAKIAKEGEDPQTVLKGIFKELTDGKNPTLAMADAIKLFGARGGTELARAVQQGKLNVDALLKSITDGKDGIVATGQATESLGDRIRLMANGALVAVEPLASAFAEGLNGALAAAGPPVASLASAFVHLGVELAPVAELAGGILLVAFKALGPILDTFSTGLDAIAGVLDHVPGPLLAVAGAAVALGLAFKSVAAGRTVTATLEAIASDLPLLINPITLAVGAVLALGIAIRVFGGHTSAASKEAKDMGKSMFDLTSTTGIFASGMDNAEQGLQKFLDGLDQAGKLKSIDDLFAKTGSTLADLSKAAGGTKAAFKSYFDEQTKGVSINPLTGGAQIIKQLADQRTAYEQTTESTIQFALRSGEITPAQEKAVEAIKNGSGASDGLSASLDRLNEIVAENVAKTDAQQVKQLAATGGMLALQQAIIRGTITTNDAASASTKFGLSLDATKGIIKSTTSALQAFVKQGLAGIPDSGTPINNWAKGVQSAFVKLADDVHNKTGSVKADIASLKKAADPSQIIAETIEQAKHIAVFADNLKKLAVSAPFAVQSLLADSDKASAASLAQILVNSPKLAAQFDIAQAEMTAGTSKLQGAIQGPLALTLARAGIVLGTAGPKAAADAIARDHGIVDALTGKTNSAADAARNAAILKSPAFAAAMKALAAAGSGGFKPDLVPPISAAALKWIAAVAAQHEPAKTAFSSLAHTGEGGFKPDLVTPATAAVHAAAGALTVNRAMGIAADEQSKTTASKFKPDISAAVTKQFGAAANLIARMGNLSIAAGVIGHEVGVAFDAGLGQGLVDGNDADLHAAAMGVARSVEATLKAAWGIKSPSTVAAAIGRNVVAGLAQGLDPAPLGTAVDRVLASLRKIAAPKIDLKPSVKAAPVAPPVAASPELTNFVSTVVGQLPTAGALIQAFSDRVAQALSTERTESDLTARAVAALALARTKAIAAFETDVHQQQVVAAAQAMLDRDTADHASKAQLKIDTKDLSAATRDLTHDNTLATSAANHLTDATGKLSAAQRQLAADQRVLHATDDAGKFTSGIQASDQQILRFQHSLTGLAHEGLGALASQLAQQGPAVAGHLAALFAISPTKAKAAEVALEQQKRVVAGFQAFVQKTFGNLFPDSAATGALGTGASIGADLLKGITDFLKAAGPGHATAVRTEIQKIIGGTDGTSAGELLARQLSAGFASKLDLSPLTRGQILATQVPAPVKTPEPAPSILQAIHQAIQVDAARPAAAAEPQTLRLELVSPDGMFEPATVVVPLTGRQIAQMKLQVRSKVQAQGASS